MTDSTSKMVDYKGIKDGKTLRLLKDPINITVRVGIQDPSAIWHLPKALLTHCSPFFAAALDGRFAEAKSNTVILPDEKPGTFETFVPWMYTGEIQFDIRPDDSYQDWSGLLVDSWVLEDNLGFQAFQDSAMIQLLAFHRQRAIKPSTVRAAYQGSKPKSKFRKWTAEQFLCDIKAEEYEDSKGKESWIRQVELIENFGQDFVTASLEFRGSDLAHPYMEGLKYMEVFTYKHDGSCECSTCGWRWPEGRTTGNLQSPLGAGGPVYTRMPS